MNMDTNVVVGIDLGTTNSEVAILSANFPEVVAEADDFILPSCVGLDEAGNVIVGHQARNQYVAAPERTIQSVKRLMGSDRQITLGDQEYSPQEISAFILKELKERAERALGQAVSRAVITVPAYFTDAQRQATREAGQIAGLEVVRIINEPTAAALTYEVGEDAKRILLVYDLGGGTFDVSVVAVEGGIVEVLSTTGDNELGGNDFDDIIIEMLNTHIEGDLKLKNLRDDARLQARLRRAAENAKIALSSKPFVSIEEDYIATVDGEARHLAFELSRTAFEAAIDNLLTRTMRSVTQALNDAGVRPSEIDRVLLVGGSTRIPQVAILLSERLGKEPHGEVDPDLCVALGAGVQAGMEMGRNMRAILLDITPYTFGTSAVGDVRGQPSMHKFVPIIRRNSKLPTTRTEAFYTIYDDQEQVEIDVYQGEDEDALENVKIASFMFTGLNQKTGASEKGILFTCNLDLDGLLHIHAVERASGREVRGVVNDVFAQSSDEMIERSRERIERAWGQDTTGSPATPGISASGQIVLEKEPEPAIRATLERANKALAGASDDDRDELQELVDALHKAVNEDDAEQKETANDQLEELLFYLE